MLRDELRPVARAGDEAFLFDLPRTAVRGKPFGGRGSSGFGEAFAEDHLAVQAAVDFVIDVFDADPGEVGGDGVRGAVGVDDDRSVLRTNDAGCEQQDYSETGLHAFASNDK